MCECWYILLEKATMIITLVNAHAMGCKTYGKQWFNYEIKLHWSKIEILTHNIGHVNDIYLHVYYLNCHEVRAWKFYLIIKSLFSIHLAPHHTCVDQWWSLWLSPARCDCIHTFNVIWSWQNLILQIHVHSSSDTLEKGLWLVVIYESHN